MSVKHVLQAEDPVRPVRNVRIFKGRELEHVGPLDDDCAGERRQQSRDLTSRVRREASAGPIEAYAAQSLVIHISRHTRQDGDLPFAKFGADLGHQRRDSSNLRREVGTTD
jgi:hypothetical protein